jgi:pantoate--beta-alanine ligase
MNNTVDQPLVFETISELQAWRAQKFAQNKHVGFVPTMGALHAGHMHLVKEAQSRCDDVVVSVFVNPMQFGPNEDYDAYPRTWESDLTLLKQHNVSAVFVPHKDEIYPKGFDTVVTMNEVAKPFDGAFRPGHFNGVATIVLKLFNIVQPHKAFFGEKDWQQVQVVERFVSDLNMNLEIIPVATMRDSEGLALSSRNKYLSEHELSIARQLNKVMKKAITKYHNGELVSEIEKNAIQNLGELGFGKLDYFTFVDAKSLGTIKEGRAVRLLVAVRCGSARLIDNMPV